MQLLQNTSDFENKQSSETKTKKKTAADAAFPSAKASSFRLLQKQILMKFHDLL